MNKLSRKAPTISECKIQASILLKSLYSNDIEKTKQAVKRFQRLPEFVEFHQETITKKDIKRKHALAVIALENGFNSWVDLKSQISFILGGFLNKWFANYAEAKSHLQSEGGFLLPYKKQFFICETNYIKQLGFDPNDPDWKLIGYDWVNPDDVQAWQRLYKKWMKIQGGNHE
jgi:hypothetical protein